MYEKNKEENIYDNFYLFKKVSLVDKYNFYDYLGMMIDGGVSIKEALSSVILKIKNPFFVNKIKELSMYISSGDSFSKSMKKIPDVFTTSEISVIESGETSGELHNSFSKLSDDIKKVHNLKLKIKAALTYPFIILIFLVIAVLVVLTYVIPSIVPIFSNSGIELPLATKLLISLSGFIINNFVVIILVFLVILILFIFYKNSEYGKLAISNFIFKTPLIGKVYRNYILSIFSSNFGTLFSSGVPIIKSLNLSAKSINNLEYEKVLQQVSQKVSKGDKITEAMIDVDETGYYFPPDFIQLFHVGEKTASIGKVTKKISDQYSIEVDNSLGILTKWIEPMAILIAGFFVLWFAFAIFGAILKVTQTVN